MSLSIEEDEVGWARWRAGAPVRDRQIGALEPRDGMPDIWLGLAGFAQDRAVALLCGHRWKDGRKSLYGPRPEAPLKRSPLDAMDQLVSSSVSRETSRNGGRDQ